MLSNFKTSQADELCFFAIIMARKMSYGFGVVYIQATQGDCSEKGHNFAFATMHWQAIYSVHVPHASKYVISNQYSIAKHVFINSIQN